MDKKTVNILGTKYTIEKRAYEDDSLFEKEGILGYCESYTKLIVVCDMFSNEKYKDEPQEAKIACEKETLRHEITHAFLNESGLRQCSHGMECGWSKDDEIVDWFAIQSPKIFKVFQELDIL